VHAGARMVTWCTGVCVTVSICTCALPCVCVALYWRCAAFAPPVCYYRRIIYLAWILEYLAARHSACLCVSMRVFVYCL